jgi:hypothetical protein
VFKKKVDLVCDRCGVVIRADVEEEVYSGGSGPHESQSVNFYVNIDGAKQVTFRDLCPTCTKRCLGLYYQTSLEKRPDGSPAPEVDAPDVEPHGAEPEGVATPPTEEF